MTARETLARAAVANAFRTARREAGLKQKEVAAMTGVADTYICGLELNRRVFPIGLAKRLPLELRRPVIEALIALHLAIIEDLKDVIEATQTR